jgi:hypothetical protein
MTRIVLIIFAFVLCSTLFAFTGAEVFAAKPLSFQEVSRVYIELYGQPEFKIRQVARESGRLVYEARQWVWMAEGIAVLFVKDTRYWKGWRVVSVAPFKHKV